MNEERQKLNIYFKSTGKHVHNFENKNKNSVARKQNVIVIDSKLVFFVANSHTASTSRCPVVVVIFINFPLHLHFYFAELKMVFVKNWEDFEIAAENMYMANPQNCRYTMKYVHSKGHILLKMTDNVKVRFVISKSGEAHFH